MLTNLQMIKQIQALWYKMTSEQYQFSLYIGQPHNGYGYNGGGEFYIYIKNDEYILSYSEHGTESIIVESVSFDDIKFEVAIIMSDVIVFKILKKHKTKYRNGMDGKIRMDIRLELLKKTGDDIYQKAKKRLK